MPKIDLPPVIIPQVAIELDVPIALAAAIETETPIVYVESDHDDCLYCEAGEAYEHQPERRA